VDLSRWYIEEVADDFEILIQEAKFILGRENDLQQIVQLIGQDALSDLERETLMSARILREDLLQQSAIHEIDAFCPLDKSYWMLKVILHFHETAQEALKEGVTLEELENAVVLQRIARMKELSHDRAVERLQFLIEEIDTEITRMREGKERINA
jgi:V/A-type H+-transporting ATPase subunit A